MNHCKSMATPGSKGQEGNNATEKLDAKEHREFRSRTGICQYMTEQRFDIAFRTKEIMREAAGPTTASKTKLKRIARHLKERQRRVLNFLQVGKLDDVIHVTVDADWARNPKTKCSTSGDCWQLARASQHVIGQRHRQQCHYPQLSQRPKRSRNAVLKLCT